MRLVEEEGKNRVEFVNFQEGKIFAVGIFLFSPHFMRQTILEANQRLASEGPSYLDKLEEIRERLVRIGNDLTQQRMRELLKRYPERPNIFVLAGVLHLPAFENLRANDGGAKVAPLLPGLSIRSTIPATSP